MPPETYSFARGTFAPADSPLDEQMAWATIVNTHALNADQLQSANHTSTTLSWTFVRSPE